MRGSGVLKAGKSNEHEYMRIASILKASPIGLANIACKLYQLINEPTGFV